MIASESLRSRLLAETEKRSQSEIAKKAGIRKSIVNEVLNPKADSPNVGNANYRRNRASAITRLCVELGYPIEKGLNENGLDPNEDGVVRSAMARAKSKREEVFNDPVLRTIQLRDGRVRIGVLTWAPFWINEGVNPIVAGLIQRLIRTCHETWTVEIIRCEKLTDAIQSVVERRDPCDMVFGLFDTPSRRAKGLSFAPLGGLGAKLGAIHISKIDEKPITWNDIIKPGQSSRPLAIVLDGEAAHQFLRGPCNYNDADNLIPIDSTLEPREIANWIADIFNEAQVKKFEPVIFVSDYVVCQRVHNVLRNRSEAKKGVRRSDGSAHRTWRPGALESGNDVILGAHFGALNLIEAEVRSMDKEGKDELAFAASYPLGIAVRGDARQWQELISHAIENELFRNTWSLMADFFIALFREWGKHFTWRWNIGDLQKDYWRAFKQKVEVELESTGLLPDEWIQTSLDAALPAFLRELFREKLDNLTSPTAVPRVDSKTMQVLRMQAKEAGISYESYLQSILLRAAGRSK